MSSTDNEVRALPLTSSHSTKVIRPQASLRLYFLLSVLQQIFILVLVSRGQVKRHSNPEKSTISRHNVKLLLAVDYTIYRRNNGRMVRILRRALDIANGIHQVYVPRQLFYVSGCKNLYICIR